MDTPPSPFTSLPPEILHLIFTLLDPPDLANCARLSSSLHKLAEPCLWRTVKVETVGQLACFRTDDAQKALTRNAHHIRHLYVTKNLFSIFLPKMAAQTPLLLPSGSSSSSTSPQTQTLKYRLRYFDPICTRLKQLHLGTIDGDAPHKHRSRYTFSREEEFGIITLILQNSALTSLKIEGVDVSIHSLLYMTKELPNLQNLEVMSHVSPWAAKLMLERLPECIKTVTLLVNLDDQRDDSILKEDYDENLPLTSHPFMESLVVPWMVNRASVADVDPYTYVGEREENVLLRFLDSCSNPLNKFGGYTTAIFCNPRLRTALDRLGAHCMQIDLSLLSDNAIWTDQDFANFIMLGTHWVDIDLDGRDEVGPLTVAALLVRCDQLRHLSIAACPGISSADICTILGRCGNLESLIAIDWDLPGPTRHPHVLGTDMIEFEWACRASLKWWSCIITVPRPDDNDKEEHGSTNSDMIESRRIQRLVYRKLAELTGLRALRLGHVDDGSEDVNDSWYQSQCLEMTLESGLDELAGLKEMEKLDVSYTKHRIGIRELEWMAERWPNLRVVSGLFRTCIDPVPGAREWVKLHHAEWIAESDEEVEGDGEESDDDGLEIVDGGYSVSQLH